MESGKKDLKGENVQCLAFESPFSKWCDAVEYNDLHAASLFALDIAKLATEALKELEEQ